jgi:hypothetical protein
MQMHFFGDSYDIVKRYLLHSLAPDAVWRAFPMFTDDVSAAQVDELAAFLGVEIVASAVFTAQTDRASHLRADPSWAHIFLDPDTGVRLRPCGGVTSTRYVFGHELVGLCHQQPDRLAVVFDQSVPRGQERPSIEAKLAYFGENHVAGFAYASHACFVVLSSTQSVIDEARARLVASHLPTARLIAP